MLKTLLNVNEDLASSIAIRYTAYLNQFVKLSLHVTHVEEVDEKEQAGTGWVRKTWEDGVASSGKRLVDRMLRTENIDCPLAGRPIIFVGDPEKEIIYELRNGLYNLFIQGFLNTNDPDNFYKLISSPLISDSPCPVLIVKNLTLSNKCVLLCTDGIDPELLVKKSMSILGDSSFTFDLLFYKFKDSDEVEILDKKEGGSILEETEALMTKAGRSAEDTFCLLGAPEQVGDYLKKYSLVSSILPKRKSMWMQVLADSLATVMLVR